MPTYDYVCTTCKKEFEHFQSMSSAPLKVCPSCSGPVKRKIGTGIAPIFKGTGFYQTDYKNSAPAEAKPETAPKSTPETKTDTPAKEPVKSSS